MKRTFIILISFLCFTCCNQNKSPIRDNSQNNPEAHAQQKRGFRSMAQLVADSTQSRWLEKKDSSSSLALHFLEKGGVSFSYSPECWFTFPYKVKKDELTVYWDKNVDTKYEFDIVKAMRAVDNKYTGRPFLILKLLNDTTLVGTYLLENVRDSINSLRAKRILFPDRFTLIQ